MGVVQGCQHPSVCNIVHGTYVPHAENHGKTVYRRTELFNDLDVMIYFWDDREGADLAGWWFAPSVDADEVWAHNPDDNGDDPPVTGWRVPHDGPIDPELTVAFQEPPREEDKPPIAVKSGQSGRAKTSTKEQAREQTRRQDEVLFDKVKAKQKEQAARHAAREAQKAKKQARLAEKNKRREALSRKQSAGLERLEERRRKEADVRTQINALKAEEEEHSRSMDELKRKEEEIARHLGELRRKEVELPRKQEDQTKKKRNCWSSWKISCPTTVLQRLRSR